MRLVIFGPQGAGKGTQGARIAEKLGIPQISTGDIFRWAMKSGTELGDQVRSYVEAGDLVPNDLTVRVVLERLAQDDAVKGFILDGFPRNLDQAASLDAFLEEKGAALDAALMLEVPQEVSIRRIAGRRVCSTCGRNYHVDARPRENWTCDVCGGDVVGRADDNEESVRKRLDLYASQTTPLKQYYLERSKLREVEGQGSPDEVFDRIVAQL